MTKKQPILLFKGDPIGTFFNVIFPISVVDLKITLKSEYDINEDVKLVLEIGKGNDAFKSYISDDLLEYVYKGNFDYVKLFVDGKFIK
jgi:hypothetical protein